MKKQSQTTAIVFLLIIAFSIIFCSEAKAQTPDSSKFKFDVLTDVSRYFLDGNYVFGNGNIGAGVTYSDYYWKAEPGIYISPGVELSNVETSVSLAIIGHLTVYERLGIGFGYRFWLLGDGVIAPKKETLFITTTFSLVNLGEL